MSVKKNKEEEMKEEKKDGREGEKEGERNRRITFFFQISVLRLLQHCVQWNLEQILEHLERYSSIRPGLKVAHSSPFILCSISIALWRIESGLIILVNLHALLLYAQIPILIIVVHLRTPLINEALACILWSLIIYYFQRKCFRQSWLYPIGFQEMYIFKKSLIAF